MDRLRRCRYQTPLSTGAALGFRFLRQAPLSTGRPSVVRCLRQAPLSARAAPGVYALAPEMDRVRGCRYQAPLFTGAVLGASLPPPGVALHWAALGASLSPPR